MAVKTATVRRTGKQLRQMHRNDEKYYWSAEDDEPYIADHPTFRDDRQVAAVPDFLRDAHPEKLSELVEDEVYELYIALIYTP